jgi:hypothetical protein
LFNFNVESYLFLQTPFDTIVVFPTIHCTIFQ